MKRFSPASLRELGYYVYLYLDPSTDEIFYVGKGRGNRAFSSLVEDSDSAKADRIRDLRSRGLEPRIEILCHGLSCEEEAYRIEAAAIDLLGTSRVTNAARGWRAGTFGRMTTDQIEALYGAKLVKVVHRAILIRINERFRYGMSATELYDATRGVWRIGQDRQRVELALAVFHGIVQEVYHVRGWFPAGSTLSSREDTNVSGRWEFVGSIAQDDVRRKYVLKSVRAYFPRGSQNPIRYANVGNHGESAISISD